MNQALYIIASELVPLVTGVVVLYYSFIAMKRLKLPGFRYWVWATGLGIVGHIVHDVSRSQSAFLSSSARQGFWVFWCVGYTVSALLGTYGTVLLVRHLIATQAKDASGSGFAATAQAACIECGGVFSIHDVISYNGVHVCARCKPIFFQKVTEGAETVRGSDPARNDES